MFRWHTDKFNSSVISGVFIVCFILGAVSAKAQMKLNLFTATDFGSLGKGEDISAKNQEYDPSGLFLYRNYIGIAFANQIDESNQINIGIGGVFWKPYEKSGSGPNTKTLSFGPGIPFAFLNYKINENMDLSYGYLNYKYNPNAKNLGEYLFRTEAYPTIIYTGGWGWMNSAAYNAFGAKYTWNALGGTIKSDLVVFMEYFNAPIYDITPAYIATIKPAEFFTIGGAVSLHRLFTPSEGVKDSTTKSYDFHQNIPIPNRDNSATYYVKAPDNTDYEIQKSWLKSESPGTDSALRQELYDSDFLLSIHYSSPDSMPMDTLGAVSARDAFIFTGIDDDLKKVDSDVHDSITNDPAYVPMGIDFDNSAVKLLSFFELDIGALMGKERSEIGEFNIYGEVALLGLKNYDLYYTQYSQRLVKMVGFSVPTFGLLDNLSIEIEHLANPNSSSIKQMNSTFEIIPDVDFRIDDETGLPFEDTDDDIKWSLQASRGLTSNLKVFLMVANDHFRMKDGGAAPMSIPVTHKKDHWYWLTRVQWSM